MSTASLQTYFQINRGYQGWWAPPGYRRVRWIGSTGVQWLDTGVVCDQTTTFECHIMHTSQQSDTRDFGCRVGSYSQGYTFGVFGSIWQFGNSRNKASVSQTLNVVMDVVFGKDVYFNGSKVLSYSVSDFNTGSRTCYIFALNNNGTTSQKASVRYYDDTVITKGGNEVRRFIPVVRLADSKPGLYDACGSICPLTDAPFYVNSGTGQDFTWGELS